MTLLYHKGNNFGDAINPIIFNHYFEKELSKSGDFALIGIGSIIAFFHEAPYSKKYIFSSGIAKGQDDTYGSIQELNSDCEIICVRGPLTAKLLNIDESYAVADGAILLRDIYPEVIEKQFEVSYMPHIGSLDFYPDLPKLINEIGFKFIDPRDDVQTIIRDIKASRLIITEALHGAIVADTFRVPWKQVKMFNTVNDFKWKDFHASMEMRFEPKVLPSLYGKSTSKKILKDKFGLLSSFIHPIFSVYQKMTKVRQFKKEIGFIPTIVDSFNLSESHIFDIKHKELLNRIDLLKSKIEE